MSPFRGIRSAGAFLALGLLIASCTTTPAPPEKGADPAGLLPPGEDFYCLVRPSAHEELVRNLLEGFGALEEGAGGADTAIARTREGVLSGRFPPVLPENVQLASPAPPLFSAVASGDFPAFFLRSSLRLKKEWRKSSGYVYEGPGGVRMDTAYRDTLLIAADEGRLAPLRTGMAEGPRRRILPEALTEWWNAGGPALMVYLPDLSALPAAASLPAVPEGTAVDMAFLPRDDAYELDLRVSFAQAGDARLWSLGLRLYLAGKMGLSFAEEERAALKALEMSREEGVLRLRGWTMTPAGWAAFFSSLG